MVARACGAVIVEINPNASPLSGDADYVLRGPAAAILPALLTAAWPDAGR
jgi:NAD-dependent deacetylase